MSSEEAGRSLLWQSKDFGFYSSELGNHWTFEAVTRPDLNKKDCSGCCMGNELYRKTRDNDGMAFWDTSREALNP